MMIKTKILLVEDDANMGFILQESLELQGYLVTRCEDGEQGQKVFLKGKFDLCLVDVMLPKMDGFSLAKEIRKVDADIPLIFLTAKALKEDRIEGFKIGGDDYITKPFSLEELLLRLQAVLKRSQRAASANAETNQFQIGNYFFDSNNLLLKINDHTKKLTPKEAQLLHLLCRYQNKELPRETALKQIWQEDNFFTARSMDVYISKLRKYLKDDARIEIINIHSKGYKLLVRVN